MNFGLERMHALLDAMDRPDERTKIVHVAGTNGKGSVCAYISSVLHTCGYTVGRFNSPHLIEPRDSINVNGEAISQELYDEAVAHANNLNTTKNIGASSFECLVGTAFYAFDKYNLDFIVLEVGLGGSLDATNAIKSPVMTVITAIGLDHANILGNTIEEIATAKAGIMKPGCPVVIAPQDSDSALDTLVNHAKSTVSPYQIVKPAQFISANVCQLDDYTYPIQLFGDYQRMNSATAVTALDWLNRLNIISMSKEQLATGMKNTRWPGRLDWIDLKGKYGLDQLLADGAHNPPATIALRNYVDSLNKKRAIWIVASTQGKNIGEMMQELIRENDIVLAVSFTQPAGMPWINSMDPKDIVQEAKAAKQAECLELEKALEKAGSIREKDDVVVLCGSLYLVADLYQSLS